MAQKEQQGQKGQIEIPVSSREIGKHFSRQSRTAGRVPAVVYGPKMEHPLNVLADEITIRRYQGRKFESVVFNLKSDDSKLNKISVILRDIQIHPVTRRPLHVDFYAPDMTKPVRVSVELRLEGKPVGFAEGGVLEHIIRDVEIEVLPADIPEFLTVDTSNMGVGDAIHVADIPVRQGVKMISPPTLTLATVSLPKEESTTPTAAAPDAAAGAAAPAATPAAGGGDKKK